MEFALALGSGWGTPHQHSGDYGPCAVNEAWKQQTVNRLYWMSRGQGGQQGQAVDRGKGDSILDSKVPPSSNMLWFITKKFFSHDLCAFRGAAMSQKKWLLLALSPMSPTQREWHTLNSEKWRKLETDCHPVLADVLSSLSSVWEKLKWCICYFCLESESTL